MLRNNKVSWDADILELRKTFDEFITLLTAQGVSCFSMQKYFERPHDYGEMFIGYFHTAYRGNELIATAIYELFVQNLFRLDTRDLGKKALLSTITAIEAYALNSVSLQKWLASAPRFKVERSRVGSIVMNCNPFTNGHKHIIREILNRVEYLYIFIVQEDLSFFSYEDRLAMMRAGVEEFGARVHIVPSGEFIISAITFPEYFIKDAKGFTADVTVEAVFFGTVIARELSLGTRFLGEEPFCPVTGAYHTQLKTLLPLCGLECVEIPRLCDEGGTAISASRVRKFIEAGDFEALQGVVPASSLVYILKQVNRLRKSKI